MTRRALVPACYLLQAMLFGVGCVTDGVHGADEAAGKTHQPETMTLDLGKGVTMKLVLIPAGTFMMGSKLSPAEDVSRYGADEPYFALEHPRHEVTISKPFYIGVQEGLSADRGPMGIRLPGGQRDGVLFWG